MLESYYYFSESIVIPHRCIIVQFQCRSKLLKKVHACVAVSMLKAPRLESSFYKRQLLCCRAWHLHVAKAIENLLKRTCIRRKEVIGR